MSKIVIARKKNESFFLFTKEGVVKITVADKSGSRSYLVIEAPESIRVFREELEKEKDTPKK